MACQGGFNYYSLGRWRNQKQYFGEVNTAQSRTQVSLSPKLNASSPWPRMWVTADGRKQLWASQNSEDTQENNMSISVSQAKSEWIKSSRLLDSRLIHLGKDFLETLVLRDKSIYQELMKLQIVSPQPQKSWFHLHENHKLRWFRNWCEVESMGEICRGQWRSNPQSGILDDKESSGSIWSFSKLQLKMAPNMFVNKLLQAGESCQGNWKASGEQGQFTNPLPWAKGFQDTECGK